MGTVIVKDMSRLGRNYLQVGIYTDIVFPENDVQFIAVNDNMNPVVQTEFDMTPIRNFCNELYARDTAKKIKSTFRMKGESGKHLTTNPPFGFVKDTEDNDKWLIDEEAAQTVRYIFKLCYDGLRTYADRKEAENGKGSDSNGVQGAEGWETASRRTVQVGTKNRCRDFGEAGVYRTYRKLQNNLQELPQQKTCVER